MTREEENQKKFNDTRTYVLRNEVLLRETYGNDYIAIKDEVVVGSNRNQYVLALDIDQKFLNEFVCIGTIEKIVSGEMIFIESPEEAG